jgi:hypothetical protein
MLNLKMQSAKCPPTGARNVILHEFAANSRLRVTIALKGFLKEPAGIAKHARLDNQDVGNRGLNHLHSFVFRAMGLNAPATPRIADARRARQTSVEREFTVADRRLAKIRPTGVWFEV